MTNKPIPAHCDAGCKKEFEIRKIRTRKVKHGIEKNFFVCPHCKQEYVTYYASEETRRLQKDMRKLHISMLGKSFPQFKNEEDLLKAKIKQSMDEARAVSES